MIVAEHITNEKIYPDILPIISVCIYCDYTYDKHCKAVAHKDQYPNDTEFSHGCCDICFPLMENDLKVKT